MWKPPPLSKLRYIRSEYKVALIAIFIGFFTLVSRLPFRSKYLFTWDSVNFALGMNDFDVIKHRPHPPGYILYIKLAQIINQWLHDPNATLVWISIISGILTVILVYLYTERRFGTTDALFASLLTLTNPLFWFYDELALSYSLEAFFSMAIAFACYQVIGGSINWAYAGAILLGLAGGFRQTTLLIMLPLSIYTARWIPKKHLIFSSILLLLICLAWVVPLIERSGGLANYLLASQQLSSMVEPQPLSVILHALLYGGHIPLLFVVGSWFGLFSPPNGWLKIWEKPFII